MSRRLRSDTGAAGSLSLVLLVPVFCVLATMAVQAAMWGHARSQVRAVAHAAAVIAARSGVDSHIAEQSARQSLSSVDGLRVDVVDIESTNGYATASISGRVPGLVHGLSSEIAVIESVPVEGWRP